MSCCDKAAAVPPSALEVRRNYAAHIIEGGMFIGAMALLNTQTILPPIVEKLGGPVWLISLVPTLTGIGFGLPSLLIAHRIDRLKRFKPFILVTGVAQRLPYLLAGLALLMARSRPILALAAVALAPLLNGLLGGLSMPAWQQLFAKTVPANRRSSAFAIRNTIGCVVGLFAGGAIAKILDRWPGTTGYGILHLVAFGCLVGSFAVFCRVREVGDHPAPEDHVGLGKNLRHAAGMLRGHRELKLLVGVTVCRAGLFVLLPFLSIHALGVLGMRDAAFLGTLLVFQMLGGIGGNVLAGVVGDRRGARLVSVMGAASLTLVAAGANLPTGRAGFMAFYAAFGFAFYLDQSSRMALVMELLPPRRRSTFLALLGVVGVASMLAASGLATALKTASVPFAGISLAAAGALAVGGLLLTLLPRVASSPAG